MSKFIDLQSELETQNDEWGISGGKRDANKIEGRSIRETFGWGNDYLERARESRSFAAPTKQRAVVHMYVVSELHDHVISDIESWGLDHHFPSFTAIERVTSAPRAVNISEPGALAMTALEVRDTFNQYRAAWQSKSQLMASPTEIVLLPEYQKTIGLGRPAVPLIIEALRYKLDNWFWALTAIVGDDHAEGAQSLQEAADRWISWYDELASND